MRTTSVRLALALTLVAPLSVLAQAGKGELWEITMSMPGMPAGMIPAQRSCQGDDPELAARKDPNKRDCKVTDSKRTATRTTVTMSCKDGSTIDIDQQYNAARTEFKTTMSTKGGKQGDMTMQMTGRKVGTCDAVAERKEREAKAEDMKKQVVAGQAAAAASMKESSDREIKQCNEALENMNFRGFGFHGQCYKKTDGQCATYKDMYKTFPEAAKACNANIAEYCRRFQTAEGFMKVRGREEMAKTCGVSIASIKATQCPIVAKKQSPLSFLGAYCPVEAKPLAQQECTGRDYTARNQGKYGAFCRNYLANADFQRNADHGGDSDSAPARASSGSAPSASGTVPAEQTQGQKSADAVKEGVNQGINKLRGLFGGK